jgi:nucleolar pre-ribosomal-associated protein 1
MPNCGLVEMSGGAPVRYFCIHYLTVLFSQTADMQEKPHVTYILNLLKNALPSPLEEKPTRLPSYASLILLHALRAIFYPSNFIYPLTARFLLQRPELDTNDVPMLYAMLYSSSDDWKKERGWIMGFLADGMMSTDDWRVLQRRHTWDILSSLFQSSEKERALRNEILEVRLSHVFVDPISFSVQVLANITCNSQAVTSLVLKSGLLQWIEMQLLNASGEEGVAWVRILQNIIMVVDHVKLESSTNGDWRAVFCRCLSLLLTNCDSCM